MADFPKIGDGFPQKEEQAPFLGKTCSVFGKNMLRFWEKHVPFLGQTGSVFGTKWLRFGENRRSLGDKLVRFLDWLGQSSSFTVLNAKHVWVWMSLKGSQPVGSWKGKMLKPTNFDIETVLGFVLGTCMRCHKRKLIYVVPIEDENT